MPLDLWLFIGTLVALLLVGLPAIRARVWIPERLEIEDVDPATMSAAARGHFEERDGALQLAGYAPVATFRATNLQGANLNRLYQSRDGSGTAVATAMTSDTGPFSQHYVELSQTFTDGSVLTSRNAKVTSVFDPLPDHVIQELAAVDDVRELRRLHDARMVRLGKRPERRRSPAELLEEGCARHERFCRVQEERGLLRRAPTGGRYHMTIWTGLRGTKNFLDPFADGFRLRRFAVGVCIGLGLPLAGVLWLGPAALESALLEGLPEIAVVASVQLLLVALSGAVVGWMFPAKTFLWSFLFGYPLVRFAGGPAWLALLSFFVMGIVAHRVSLFMEERARIA